MSTKKVVPETSTQAYSRIKAEEKAASELARIQSQLERENRSLKRDITKQVSSAAVTMSEQEALIEEQRGKIAEQKEELAKFALMQKEYFSNIDIHKKADESRQLDIIAAKQKLVQAELQAKQAELESKRIDLEALKYAHDNPATRTSTDKKATHAKLGSSQPTFSGNSKDGMTIRQWVLTTEVNLMTIRVAEEFKAYVAGTYLRESACSLFHSLVQLMPTELTWDELKKELFKVFEPPNIKMLIYNQIQDLKQSSCPTLNEFIEKFRSLATQSDLSEETKVSAFVRGLNDNLRGQMLQNVPHTLVEVIAKASEINTSLFLCQKEASSGFRGFNAFSKGRGNNANPDKKWT